MNVRKSPHLFETTSVALVLWSLMLALWPSRTIGQPNPVISDEDLASEDLRQEAWPGWSTTARDEWSTTREYTNWVADSSGTGQMPQVHRIIEIASGLHYLDDDGRWRKSKDLIELLPDGRAAGLRAPMKVYFSGDLMPDAAITVITKSKRVLSTHPIGIYYFDPVTRHSVLVAGVNDSAAAELFPPNQIVYRGAFESDAAKADLQLTFTKAGYESDVIFTRRPKSPDNFQLDLDTTQIQVRHAWFNAPTPQRTATSIGPNIIDEILDFGDLWFPPGRAFAPNAEASPDTNSPAPLNITGPRGTGVSVRVGKHWDVLDGVSVLTESVSWKQVEAELSQLPEIASAKSAPVGNEHASLELGGRGLNENPRPSKRVQVAKSSYRERGFVIDYGSLTGGTNANISSGTWLVSGLVSFTGNVLFYNDVVLKYAPSASIYIYGNTPITFSGPMILTSKDEDVFGQRIYSSTGAPTYAAGEALWIGTSLSQTLPYLTIRWAQTAIEIDGNGSGLAHTLQNSSIQYCQTAVYDAGCIINFQSSSKCNVGTAVDGHGTWGVNGALTDICGPSLDSDTDGLPDSWMIKYFGHATGQAGDASRLGDDADSDGATNQQEYNAGTSPVDHPVLPSLPIYKIAHQGNSVTLSASANPAYLHYDWKQISAQHETLETLRWSGANVIVANPQVSDCGEYHLYVYANNPKLAIDPPANFRLVVLDDYGWNVWQYHLATSTGKSAAMWSSYTLPIGWPTVPPVLSWNPNSILYGKTGFTGISQCNSFQGSQGQVGVTLISKRHGYTAICVDTIMVQLAFRLTNRGKKCGFARLIALLWRQPLEPLTCARAFCQRSITGLSYSITTYPTQSPRSWPGNSIRTMQ